MFLLLLQLCWVFICHSSLISGHIVPYPTKPIAPSPYASWAHHHWVWLSHSQESQQSLTQLVDDYQSRDIPVGAVNIDSGWSTGYNNFVWDEKKFPNPKQFISSLHDKDIRVIAWSTSMINKDSSNWQEGLDKGYYLNSGRTLKWWHGVGSFIDYTNEEAMNWWHEAMDKVLDIGLDGWKTDGTDPYPLEFILIHAKKGYISQREYANAYYHDFFYHTRQKRGKEALIMARPIDSFEFELIKRFDLYWKFAPRDTMFSGWVGDQDPEFSGLRAALRNMFHSSWNNYTNYGSDIGGYRSYHGNDTMGHKLGRTKNLFLRWAQLGSFTPLMENGGDNEHRPWKFDEAYSTNDTLSIYRNFVHIHLELGPYLYSAGSDAYEQNVPVIMPMSAYSLQDPSTYDFKLWHDIFVSPIIDDVMVQKNIRFPEGDQWVDWWDESKIYAGGSVLPSYPVPLSKYPVFKRKGSIIPLNVTSRHTSHILPDLISNDQVIFLITYPDARGGKTSIRHLYKQGYEASYTLSEEDANSFDIFMQITPHDHEIHNAKFIIRGISLSQLDWASLRLWRKTGQGWERARVFSLKSLLFLRNIPDCFVLLRHNSLINNDELVINGGDTRNGVSLRLSFKYQ